MGRLHKERAHEGNKELGGERGKKKLHLFSTMNWQLTLRIHGLRSAILIRSPPAAGAGGGAAAMFKTRQPLRRCTPYPWSDVDSSSPRHRRCCAPGTTNGPRSSTSRPSRTPRSRQSTPRSQRKLLRPSRVYYFAQFGVIFLRFVAAKGDDPNINSALAQALMRAKDVSLPKVNVENAIKKGLGKTDEGNMEAIVYEGVGPKGIAIIVEALTEKKTRTVSNIRTIFSKNGFVFSF